MANHYTQFSFIIPLEPDEVAWVQRVLHDADRAEEIEGEEEQVLKTHGPAQKFFMYIFEERNHGNEWAIHTEGGTHVWIHADEGSDLEAAALFAQAYLRCFHPQQAIAFTWCEFCDKPRAGAFSGGGCFITKDDVKMENAYDVVRRFMGESRAKVRSGSPYDT
jgi:hypothetical protein